MSRKVHFVSLGCPKNTVDTQRMVALAKRQGLDLADHAEDSEIIVVNTCGFIESAKQESIDTVLEMASFKHDGACQKLVMAGCLSQRYPQDLARELPEVDHFLGTADLGRLAKILDKSAQDALERVWVGQAKGMEEAQYERALTGARHTAYVKISEGCDRPCSFCSIPIMRGRQRSRTIASLTAEVEQLCAQGVREIILVAQDSTAYGRDLPRGEANLTKLLTALDKIEGLHWIRIHYAYPSMVKGDLVEAIDSLESVALYIDMPIQHVDDQVLRYMRRGYTGDRVRRSLDALREKMPDLAVRTTMLVGHPGETEQAHKDLLEFIEAYQIDHLGAFPFSPEDGTPAADLPDAVPAEVGQARRDELMERQRDVSRLRLKRLVGRTLEVLVDGPSDESEFLLQARYAGQSPGIDGVVFLADAEANPGDFVQAQVTDSADYDVAARQLPD